MAQGIMHFLLRLTICVSSPSFLWWGKKLTSQSCPLSSTGESLHTGSQTQTHTDTHACILYIWVFNF